MLHLTNMQDFKDARSVLERSVRIRLLMLEIFVLRVIVLYFNIKPKVVRSKVKTSSLTNKENNKMQVYQHPRQIS